jgi:hypothetical protein
MFCLARPRFRLRLVASACEAQSTRPERTTSVLSSGSPLMPASPGESSSSAASRCRLMHDRPGARSCHGSSAARAAPRKHRPNWPEPNSVATFRQNQPQTAGLSSTHGDADPCLLTCKSTFSAAWARSLHTREAGTDCSRRSARSNQSASRTRIGATGRSVSSRRAASTSSPRSSAARRRFVASRLLRNRLLCPREAARKGISKREMFPPPARRGRACDPDLPA